MISAGGQIININQRIFIMINNLRIYSILLVGVIWITCAYSQEFDRNLKLPKYQLDGNGISFKIESGSHNVIRMDHGSNIKVVESDKNFNHGVRRGKTIIATGDVPTFALLRVLPMNKLDPDILRLGDVRILVGYGGKEEWLDEAASIKTVFNNGTTVYTIQSAVFPDLKFKVTICQAYDWGMSAKVTVMNKMKYPADLQIKFNFGRSDTIKRTFSADYFKTTDKVTNNEFFVNNNIAVLHQKGRRFKSAATTLPSVNPEIIDTTANFNLSLKIPVNKSDSVYFFAGQSDDERVLFDNLISVKKPELLILESLNYYANLLKPYSISTPGKILDAGFMTAIVNLDCVYNGDSAWLEGIHWWPAYWTNNFQISAAISLNQLNKAGKAFRIFNTKEHGLCTTVTYTGQSADSTAEDGIPYYIYELSQYIDFTGDTTLLKEIWPALSRGIERMWKVRDDNNNSLLNWHHGCNAFLYQADHLALPGDAASPSLMMAAMLEKAALMADLIRKTEDAEKWRSRSVKMYELLVPMLWNKPSGAFYSHIDQQSIAHLCHYYTDLVFPSLYTNLDEIFGWQSLDYLKRSLCFESNSGINNDNILLMRVGDLKPSIFGNDNVMPVQMAEAARAFFKTGDNTTGFRMLESVALAGTINTEAPGNFPERMNDCGKGEANYLFGNPIGSFIHGVVSGLFGLSLRNEGKILEWSPAFPEGWNYAKIKLPYAKTQFSLEGKEIITAVYNVEYEKQRSLLFSTFLRPCKINAVLVNGKPVPYKLTPELNKIKIQLKADAAFSHEIKLVYKLQNVNDTECRRVEESTNLSLTFSSDIQNIQDPQSVLRNIKLSGNKMVAVVSGNPGHHQFFVKLKDPDVYIPVALNIEPHLRVQVKSATYSSSDKILKTDLVVHAPSMKKKSGKLTIKLLDRKAGIPFNNTDSVNQSIFFKNIDIPSKGVYAADFILEDNNGNILKTSVNFNLSGIDNHSDSLMQLTRNKKTEFIDISDKRNSHSIFVSSQWVNKNITIDRNVFINWGDTIKTNAGIFSCPKTENTLAIIEYGKSQRSTAQTIRSGNPSVMVFPVNGKIMNLSLFFISELQSRHTGTRVGELKLNYDNGETTLIPLITGQNISMITPKIVPELETVYLHNLPVGFARVLQVPCNSSLTLKSFSVEVNASDVEFGLIGSSIVHE